MSIVRKAQADLTRLNAAIDEWTNDFLELLGNVAPTKDLVFQEAGELAINFLALCGGDSSNLIVIEEIPPTQAAEQRKRTLAKTSVIAAALYNLGHRDVAVALLADNEGKLFKYEGFCGRARTIRGCSRMPEAPSQVDFSAIPGHSVVSPSVHRFSN
jgi:hypothetical protein